MATRNFIQQGLAYGTVPASVVVTLDGQQIYSGLAETINQPLPTDPIGDINESLCAWTLPADTNGPLSFTVAVTGSPLVLADTTADLTNADQPETFYNLVYSQTVDGVSLTDPFTNVTIDGVTQTRGTDLTGQWYWTIMPGQTLSATINIVAAVDYPEWQSDQSYPANSAVVHNNRCWTNGPTPAAAGLEPGTDYMTWFVIPVPIWENTKTFTVNTYAQTLLDNNLWMALQNVPTGIAVTDTAYWQLRFSAAGVPGTRT